jgi:hypothetical protein
VFTGSPVSAAGSTLGIRLKEHQRHIRIEHPDISAVAKHSIDQGHCIQFHSSSMLARKTRYIDRIISEAIEIELYPYKNQQRGLLSRLIMEA